MSDDSPRPATIEEVHLACAEALKVYDTCFVDTFLATYISNRMGDDPLWVFFVGSPSSNKSLFMRCFEKLPEFYPLSKITPTTLVSGNPNFPGIAPLLNGKVVCFNDLGPILGMDPLKKLEIWSQFRELYDGKVTKSFGNKPPVTFSNIKCTVIANTTPHIDNERSIFNLLGSREVMYRLPENSLDESMTIADNACHYTTSDIMNHLAPVIKSFLEGVLPWAGEISIDIIHKLNAIAWFVGYMRATATYDRQTGEAISSPVREEPVRLFKTFCKFYRAFKSLDPDYPEAKIFKIIIHIAISCCQPGRVRMLQALCSKKLDPAINADSDFEWSTYELSRVAKIGEKSCFSQLTTLEALGLVTQRRISAGYRPEYKWEVTELGRKVFSIISNREGPEQ